MGFGHYVAHVRGVHDGSIFQWFNINDSLVRALYNVGHTELWLYDSLSVNGLISMRLLEFFH